MPNTIAYKILEACQEAGCPLCRLEQQSVERYLDSHFYEDVNSPAWRERLRASLGFCHEHAWLAVNQRLGDALGFAIIYHDLATTILSQMGMEDTGERGSRRWTSLRQPPPEQARTLIERLVLAVTPQKACPVCEHRDEVTGTLVSVLVEELKSPQLIEALEASEGLCLPHLRSALEQARQRSAGEQLVRMHRAKLEGLKAELAEFVRKNDYQAIAEGFGKEGDAWLRAVSMLVGSRKKS